MKSDELIEDYCFDATDNKTKAVYPKADVDAAIAELKDELNRSKAREDVLVTDNRDLLEKVKILEESLLENAEHFKRNEAQILENADKVIAEMKEKYKELAKRHDKAIQACCDADKVIRHHKYKRCLAMARWCESVLSVYPWYGEISHEERRWLKWQQRWLELAEKFKEDE